MMNWYCLFLVLFVLSGTSACAKDNEISSDDNNNDNAKEKVFKAGASKIDITGNPPSNYVVHDNLNARTLVLDNGVKKLIFVVVDEQVVPREVFDEAKRLIVVDHKINQKHIMMSATHTHSAGGGNRAAGTGTTDLGYAIKYSWNANRDLDSHQKYVARQIAKGVRKAINNLEPAKIGWGFGSVPEWSHNRRMLVEKPIVNPYNGFDKVASPIADPN